MGFEPAHDIYLGYAPETLLVTESGDGEEPAIAPALPSSFAIIGYLKNTPEVKAGLNNSLGFAVGSQKAAYRKRGARNPEGSLTMSVTNKSVLQKAIPDPATGALPRLCFIVGRPGVWTIAMRDSKIATADISCREAPTGEASEVQAQINPWACYTEYLAAPLSFNTATLLRALGDPFYWHDVRRFLVTDHDGNQTDYRNKLLSSWRVNIDNSLERCGERPNFGDHEALSNTNYFLLEHQQKVTGEIGLNGRLPAEYFNGAAQAQDWGDIILAMSNAPGLDVPGDGKTFDLTLEDCMPSDNTLNGVEASARIGSTIPFMAFGASIT